MTVGAKGVVERPDDPQVGMKVSGWDKTLDWLDNLGSAVGKVGGIAESTSGIAESIAAGKRAIDDANTNREKAKQDLFLDKFKVLRGDNKHLYWAYGAAALAFVVISTK